MKRISDRGFNWLIVLSVGDSMDLRFLIRMNHTGWVTPFRK